MRNRTRATPTNNAFLPPKKADAQLRGRMVGISDAQRKKGKSTPWVRFLVKAYATIVTLSCDWTFWKSRRYS